MGEYTKSGARCDQVIKRNPLHFGALSGYGLIYIQFDEPEQMKGRGSPVTFSIGIATFIRKPPTIEDMIPQVDHLMYSVKHSGKGAIKQQVFGA